MRMILHPIWIALGLLLLAGLLALLVIKNRFPLHLKRMFELLPRFQIMVGIMLLSAALLLAFWQGKMWPLGLAVLWCWPSTHVKAG